jgi:hypothetical protein
MSAGSSSASSSFKHVRDISYPFYSSPYLLPDAYYRRAAHDTIALKTFGESLLDIAPSATAAILVYAAVLIQVGETFLESVVAYRYLVSGWGNPSVDSFESNFQPLFNAVCKCAACT